MVRILFDERQIETAVRRIAKQIAEEFRGQEVVLVCVLKGAFIFAADLMRQIEWYSVNGGVTSCRIEFMRASSYGDSHEPGDVKVTLDVEHSLRGQNVILVEDIADTLHTLARLQTLMHGKEPKTLRTAVLLTKPHRHQRDDVTIDYIGFVGDGVGFVVGYGMDDTGGIRRGLPYIGLAE